MYVCMYVYIKSKNIIKMYTCMFKNRCMYTYIYIYVCVCGGGVCMYVQYVCTHVHLHACVHTYIHTYIHAYIQTDKQTDICQRVE